MLHNLLTRVLAGSCFGELAMLRAATVRAAGDVEVHALRRDGVVQAAHAHADPDRYLKAIAQEDATADRTKTRDAAG